MKINFMKLCSGTLMSGALLCGATASAVALEQDAIMASLPAYSGEDLELKVNQKGTHFSLWSPQPTHATRRYLLLSSLTCQ